MKLLTREYHHLGHASWPSEAWESWPESDHHHGHNTVWSLRICGQDTGQETQIKILGLADEDLNSNGNAGQDTGQGVENSHTLAQTFDLSLMPCALHVGSWFLCRYCTTTTVLIYVPNPPFATLWCTPLLDFKGLPRCTPKWENVPRWCVPKGAFNSIDDEGLEIESDASPMGIALCWGSRYQWRSLPGGWFRCPQSSHQPVQTHLNQPPRMRIESTKSSPEGRMKTLKVIEKKRFQPPKPRALQ